MRHKAFSSKVAVIWVDSEQARLYLFCDKGVMKLVCLKVAQSDSGKGGDENQLFRESSNALEEAENIFILGPGIAKHHFAFQRVFDAMSSCQHHAAIQQTALASEAGRLHDCGNKF